MMTIAAVVERVGWQAKVSNIAAKSQQIPGKVIKVQVLEGFFSRALYVFSTKMRDYAM